jgi:hypothetical protein
MTQALTYSLTFAGIPFSLDLGISFRAPFKGSSEFSREGDDPATKQQPLAELTDEFDKKLPFRYLQEFSITRPLASDYPYSNPDIAREIGDMYYPHGMRRFGYFRAFATSSQAAAMVAAVGGTSVTLKGGAVYTWSTGTFVMSCTPAGATPVKTGTVSTPMYLLPPRPMAETSGKYDGLYLITLVDDRFYHWPKKVSLTCNTNTGWNDLVQQIATALGVTITLPNLEAVYLKTPPDPTRWTRVDYGSDLLDHLAYTIQRVVVRNFNGTYTLQTASTANSLVLSFRGSIPILTAGGLIAGSGTLKIGDVTNSKNGMLPNTLYVRFPQYAGGSYVGYYQSAITLAMLNLPYTGVGYQSIDVDSPAYVASSTDTKPTNKALLDQTALQTAINFYTWLLGPFLDETYPGIVTWSPEGFNDLVYTYSAKKRQASTRILRVRAHQEDPATVPSQSSFSLTVRDSFSGSLYPWPAPPSGVCPSGFTGYDPTVCTTQNTYNPYVGPPSTLLANDIKITDQVAYFASIDFLPTNNRWRGLLNGEVILFEGTSGGLITPMSSGCPTGMMPLNVEAQPPASLYQLTLAGPGYVLGPSGQLTHGQAGYEQGASGLNFTYSGGAIPTTVYGGYTPGSGYQVQIAVRGMDNTPVLNHFSGELVTQVVPDITYNVNEITFGKTQFIYPGNVSGPVKEVVVLPQIQNVYVTDGCPIVINNMYLKGGQVQSMNLNNASGNVRTSLEFCWIWERNGYDVPSGKMLDGNLIGYSATYSGQQPSAPVYAVNWFNPAGTPAFPASGPSSGPITASNDPRFSGTSGCGCSPFFNTICGSGSSLSSLYATAASTQVQINGPLYIGGFQFWNCQAVTTLTSGIIDPVTYGTQGATVYTLNLPAGTTLNGVSPAQFCGSLAPQIIALVNESSDPVVLANNGPTVGQFRFPGPGIYLKLRYRESAILWWDTCAGQNSPGWKLLSYTGIFEGSGPNASFGMVPTPPFIAKQVNFLREDATWQIPTRTVTLKANYTVSPLTDNLTMFEATTGLTVSLPGGALAGFQNGFTVWVKNITTSLSTKVFVNGLEDDGPPTRVYGTWAQGFMFDGGNWLSITHGWTQGVSVTGKFSVVTDVSCQSGILTVTKSLLTFVKGVLKSTDASGTYGGDDIS